MTRSNYARHYIETHWAGAPDAVADTARAGYVADEDLRQITADIEAGLVDSPVSAVAAELLSECVED